MNIREELAKRVPLDPPTEDGPLTAYAKVFVLGSRYTYLVASYDRDQDIVFGFCVGPFDKSCDEYGYASVGEWDQLGFRVEVETTTFKPQPMPQAIEQEYALKGEL